MTSSTKPEVHYLSQCHYERTDRQTLAKAALDAVSVKLAELQVTAVDVNGRLSISTKFCTVIETTK